MVMNPKKIMHARHEYLRNLKSLEVKKSNE